MRRGEIWRYEPVMQRAGQSMLRLVISSDAVNQNDTLPTVYVMHVVNSDPGSLLAVAVAPFGWATAMEIDRPLRKRLVELLGSASPEQMEQVDNAVRATFDV